MVNSTQENIAATAIVDLSRYPLGAETPLTQHEVAELYGLTYRTIECWRRQGSGPRYFRIGIRPRYRLGDVIRWQRERLVASTLEEGGSSIGTQEPANDT